MKRFSLINVLIIAAVAGWLLGGCAYFNTMYNAQKKFEEAERETEAAPEQQETSGTTQQSAAQTRPVPIEKYRKVIETAAKLLENHPKSRWVDNVLLLMGISYYRINDMPRAERKFSELITLFPNSPLVPAALTWKARVMSEQKRSEEAIELLLEGSGRIKSGRQKAEALFLLGNLYYDLKRWQDAADQFRVSLQQRQPRGQRIASLYRYGLSLYYSGNYAEARNALSESAKTSNNLTQSYNSYVYWSRCELALKNPAQAEAILLRVRSNERFLDYTDDIELELAQLAIETGRIDDAVGLYENYIAQHETGEGRGLAFYRLANIHRYHRMNLLLAKSLLDSVIRTGANRVIADSARATLDQISKGLLALENIKQLKQQLESVESGGSSEIPSPVPQSPPTTVILDTSDSETQDSTQDSLFTATTEDTTKRTLFSPKTDQSKRLSPAALAADSILSVLRARDEVLSDTVKSDSGAVTPSTTAQANPKTEAQPSRIAVSRESLQWQLQRAYLLIAEFYEYSMADHDSAEHYYSLAASSPINKDVFWKANLFLAQRVTQNDSGISEDAARRYRAVVETDSVPVEAANIARKALALPLLEIPVSPQHTALRVAEAARSAGQVSTDSLLRLYSDVIQMDSSTQDARSALFAKAYIYENVLHRFDSARVVYQSIMTCCSDPSYATWIEEKLSPPDSNSVFFRSDQELFGKREAVEAILQPAKPEDGWPPPEETLRGRRYR